MATEKADFKKDLSERLVKKGVSENSIVVYMRNLSKLADKPNFTNFKFLNKVEDVIKKLENFKPSTRKSYILCIISVLGVFPENKSLTKLKQKYYEIFKEDKEKEKETPTAEMSKTQSENWLDWNDIMKRWEELHEEVMKYGKTLTEAQFNQMLFLVVMSLYTLTPPRRNKDYMLMFVKKSVKDDDSKAKNYYDVEKGEFIFNVFKTSKQYANSKEEVPEKLKHVLQMWFKVHPLLKGKKITKDTDVPLLVFKNGEPFTQDNTITRVLNRVFGKKIGVSMLRHSYLSGKYGENLKERAADAKAMGHSLATQNTYIKEGGNIPEDAFIMEGGNCGDCCSSSEEEMDF